jgi:hypothetical protein
MRIRWLPALLLCALALASCETAHYARPGSEPPPAAGTARIYFYRDRSYQSFDWTTVSLNHQRVGQSAPGTVFYRDVAPGRYEIEVRSDQLYPDQFKTVALRPGDVAYVKVQELPQWGQTAWGPRGGTTFVVTVVDPAAAKRAIASLGLTPG